MTTYTTLKDIKARVSQYARDPEFTIFGKSSAFVRKFGTYTIDGVPVGTTIAEVSDVLDVMLYAAKLQAVVRDMGNCCNIKALPYCFVGQTNDSIRSKFLTAIDDVIATYENPEYVGNLPELIAAKEQLLNM